MCKILNQIAIFSKIITFASLFAKNEISTRPMKVRGCVEKWGCIVICSL